MKYFDKITKLSYFINQSLYYGLHDKNIKVNKSIKKAYGQIHNNSNNKNDIMIFKKILNIFHLTVYFIY